MIYPPMHTSMQGLELTKSFESCRLESYQDDGGKWTIGWGATGTDVHAGQIWSQDTADMRFVQDVSLAENEVNWCVNIALSQGEFDALVDFVFNLGGGSLESSTMLRLLNDGLYGEAADQFERWDHVRGVAIAGLLRRRIAEEQEFKE